MKKWFVTLVAGLVLTACSVSNESKQLANDTFEKSDLEGVGFAPLATGGVSLPTQDPTYQIPQVKLEKATVDIRPPQAPIAIIRHSIAQFDGERALIAYPADKKEVYSLKQVERLLREQGISYKSAEKQIITDWAKTGRADDVGDVQARYLIEQVSTKDHSALLVSILEMKRDDVVFSPSFADKQRYASDRLNQFIFELDGAYQQQAQALSSVSLAPIHSGIVTDPNQHTALGINAPVATAWEKVGSALSQLGFKTSEENVGRGSRVLKYKPLEDDEWLRFALPKPELERGTYHMQLNAYGQQSAVVIFDENNQALSAQQAQSVYKALQQLLAR